MQSIFLVAYRLVRKSGVFESGVGQACFEGAYDLYKRLFEASHADWLRPLARPGTTVVDIGANIGFFTVQFARWVGSQGRVIAIEPETRNLARLRKRITGQGLASNVEIVEAVVAEKPGTLNLHLNPDHPGDHRIGSEGVPVTSVTLDGLLEDAGWPEVSLVKVDVQGAEFRVFLGAEKTLTEIRPALYVEVDRDALASMGSSAEALLDRLAASGYRAHEMGPDGPGKVLSIPDVLEILPTSGYLDILFLPTGT